MLRRIILIAAIIGIPVAFYFAMQYGEKEAVTFDQAIATAAGQSEQEQSAKVLIRTTITQTQGEQLFGEDRTGHRFRIDYTGSEFESPFQIGETYRFVGHVHGSGTDAYFHATQVYEE